MHDRSFSPSTRLLFPRSPHPTARLTPNPVLRLRQKVGPNARPPRHPRRPRSWFLPRLRLPPLNLVHALRAPKTQRSILSHRLPRLCHLRHPRLRHHANGRLGQPLRLALDLRHRRTHHLRFRHRGILLDCGFPGEGRREEELAVFDGEGGKVYGE